MDTHFVYVQPIKVDNLEECYFYHRMHLPDVGEVGGEWDLRATVNAYLGEVDFASKRVLDVGAASGFLSFEMEKRGAEVVSFDMASGLQWDLVPHCKIDLKEQYRRVTLNNQRLKNAYWFAHRKLHSNAKVYYGNIYDFPEALGTFDVVFLGMILSHLRDPFQSLYSASLLSADMVIITNPMRKTATPAMYFLPDLEKTSVLKCWWSFSEQCIQQMLGVLGFEVKHAVTQSHYCSTPGREGFKPCTTFVAQRMSLS